MPWQICDPRAASKRPLREDECRVRRSGELVIAREAALKAGLNGSAVVLVDKDTSRIGLRAPDANEPDFAVKLRSAADHKSKSCTDLVVHAKLAFKMAGWALGKTCKLAGVRPVHIRAAGPDDPAMLIVRLGEGDDD